MQIRLISGCNSDDHNCSSINFAHSKNLNVLSLGKDVATSFGVKYQPSVIYTLVLVAILMSISTALIGTYFLRLFSSDFELSGGVNL